jgi:hypothetical protein
VFSISSFQTPLYSSFLCFEFMWFSHFSYLCVFSISMFFLFFYFSILYSKQGLRYIFPDHLIWATEFCTIQTYFSDNSTGNHVLKFSLYRNFSNGFPLNCSKFRRLFFPNLPKCGGSVASEFFWPDDFFNPGEATSSSNAQHNTPARVAHLSSPTRPYKPNRIESSKRRRPAGRRQGDEQAAPRRPLLLHLRLRAQAPVRRRYPTPPPPAHLPPPPHRPARARGPGEARRDSRVGLWLTRVRFGLWVAGGYGAQQGHSDERNSARRVADHYSARSNQTLEERENSPIIHLKKLNNWVGLRFTAMHGRP